MQEVRMEKEKFPKKLLKSSKQNSRKNPGRTSAHIDKMSDMYPEKLKLCM